MDHEPSGTLSTAAAGRPRALVVQHVACEPLGTLETVLAQRLDLIRLAAHADPVAYRHAVTGHIDAEDYAGLVLLGAPMAVYEHAEIEGLDDSLRLVRATLRAGLPILGICLGSQLLAWALGGQVRSGRTMGLRKEIGWFPVHLTQRGVVDPLFHGFDQDRPVFHWHGDTFALPEGAWHLASSDLYPNQAFRWGRWTYGLQFHVEVTPALVATFVESYAEELATLDYVDGAAVVAQAAEFAPDIAAKARVVAEHFSDCVLTAHAERTRALGGRA
jgi:GMP synthase - Glutamine amidotransferase domain